MSGKRMESFERQSIRVNRRFVKTVGDSTSLKSLHAAKKGRVFIG